MAIDTEGKRRSVMGIRAVRRILPLADGSISSVDRAHIYIYSGILIGSVSTVGAFNAFRPFGPLTPMAPLD